MSREHEPLGIETSLWSLDEELGHLALENRLHGEDVYAVRLKARTDERSYRAARELYPLSHDGTVQEIAGKAYVLVPDITLSVDVESGGSSSPTRIGTVTDSS